MSEIENDDRNTSATTKFLALLRQDSYPVVPQALQQAAEALEELRQHEMRGLTETAELPDALVLRVADEVLAGRGFPADFAQQAHAATTAADRLQVSTRMAAVVRETARDRFPALIDAALPALMTGLRTEMHAVLTELTKVDADLGDLDITSVDAVADATTKQRAAIKAIKVVRYRYNKLRQAQKVAIQASSLVAPGVTNVSVGHGWAQVFEAGVHEFANVREYGQLQENPSSTARLRGLVHRQDVWMPDPADLHQAWFVYRPKPKLVGPDAGSVAA